MSKNFKLPVGTPVPTKFTQLISVDWQQNFTWKQRLQILFGYGAIIRVRIACQHCAGRIVPKIELTTTPELLPNEPCQDHPKADA
jgi:hypothetical protein